MTKPMMAFVASALIAAIALFTIALTSVGNAASQSRTGGSSYTVSTLGAETNSLAWFVSPDGKVWACSANRHDAETGTAPRCTASFRLP
jgi:hypothetical protein